MHRNGNCRGRSPGPVPPWLMVDGCVIQHRLDFCSLVSVKVFVEDSKGKQTIGNGLDSHVSGVQEAPPFPLWYLGTSVSLSVAPRP